MHSPASPQQSAARITKPGADRALRTKTPSASVVWRGAASLVDSLIVTAIGTIAAFVVRGLTHASSEAAAVATIVFSISSWLYYTLTESSVLQGTLGKVAFGLRVIDRAGNRISFAAANRRYWSKLASTMLLCIGHAIMLFGKRHHALHDRFAGTDVVKVRA